MRHADIRRIDVTIDVEVADVTVALLAHVVRQPTHGQKIARTIEHDAVGGRSRSPAKTFSAMGWSWASLILSRPTRSRTGFAPDSPAAELVCTLLTFGDPVQISLPSKAALRLSDPDGCSPKHEEQHTNIAVYGEKRSIEAAQVVGLYQRMLPDQHGRHNQDAGPRGPGKRKAGRQPHEQSDHHYMQDAGD